MQCEACSSLDRNDRFGLCQEGALQLWWSLPATLALSPAAKSGPGRAAFLCSGLLSLPSALYSVPKRGAVPLACNAIFFPLVFPLPSQPSKALGLVGTEPQCSQGGLGALAVSSLCVTLHLFAQCPGQRRRLAPLAQPYTQPSTSRGLSGEQTEPEFSWRG